MHKETRLFKNILKHIYYNFKIEAEETTLRRASAKQKRDETKLQNSIQ